MEHFLNSDNLLWVIGIICYTTYQIVKICRSTTGKVNYDELLKLHELFQKGIITQQEYEDRKDEILKNE